MIVFSAKLIDHIPRWAICLLKGHPGPGKVDRREPRAVVTTGPSLPAEALGVWGPSQGSGGVVRGREVMQWAERWADPPQTQLCALWPFARTPEVLVGHGRCGKSKSEWNQGSPKEK